MEDIFSDSSFVPSVDGGVLAALSMGCILDFATGLTPDMVVRYH